MEADFLLPDVEDPDAAEFWAGCARGELLVQTCKSCGLRRMPPRPMCPRCRSLEFRFGPHTQEIVSTTAEFVCTHTCFIESCANGPLSPPKIFFKPHEKSPGCGYAKEVGVGGPR